MEVGARSALRFAVRDLDGLKLRARTVDNAALVLRQEQREVVSNYAISALALVLFALHFVVLTTSRSVQLLSVSTSAVVGLSLVFALIAWVVMLLPAIPASLTRMDAAKRRADAAIRNLQARSEQVVSVDRRELLRGPQTDFSSLLRASTIPRLMRRVRNTPEYWVARLLRLGFYSACYVASTYWMVERTDRGTWIFEDMPPFFFFVNFVSLWTNYFDYMLELQSGRWEFVFSLGSLVELTTQPPFILVVSGILSALSRLEWRGADGVAGSISTIWQVDRLSSDPNLYLFEFGFLRFLAAHHVSAIMLTKLRVRSTRVRVFALVVTVFCIFAVIAGAMFVLEARLAGPEYVNYFDFFFFAVVTGSTVGYGDFAPSTPLSRLVVIIAILLTIAVVPAQITKLQDALNEEPKSAGTPPRPGEPYVLVTGAVSPVQLEVFVRSLERCVKDDFHRPPAKVVVLSPLPVEQYESASRSALLSVFVYRGDMLRSLELGTSRSPINLRSAIHAFVFGGTEATAEDDMAAMLRCLALLNFVPNWSITCTINRAVNMTMAANMGVWSTLCVNDLQMRWLARSITDTPGLISLMANLIAEPLEHKEAKRLLKGEHLLDHIEHVRKVAPASRADTGGLERELNRMPPTALERSASSSDAHIAKRRASTPLPAPTSAAADMRDYLLGAESQLIVSRLPAWAIGLRASELYDVFAQQDGLQLLAVSDERSMHIFQGGTQLLSQMHGVYVCRSALDLDEFLQSKQPPPGMALAPVGAVGKSGEPALPAPAPAPAPRRLRASAPALGFTDGNGELTSTQLGALLRGDRIVILGAPHDVDILITLLLGGGRNGLTTTGARYTHVMHVCLAPFAGLHKVLAKFAGGAHGEQPRYTFVQDDPLNHEVLKAHLLAPGLHSVIIFHDHLAASADQQMDAAVCVAKVETMLPSAGGAERARVFISLASTASIRFIERASWWPVSDSTVSGHLTSPTYAAGQVFGDEMLFPLMMSWRKAGLVTFCRNLTDDALDPVSIKLVDLPADLAWRAEPTPAFASPHPLGGGEMPPTQGAPVPHPTPSARHRLVRGMLTYGELKVELLRRGRLPIGLFRQRLTSGLSDRALRAMPYTFTNPPNATPVRDSDRVYVLQHKGDGGARWEHSKSGREIEEAARKIQASFRQVGTRRWKAARIAKLELDGVLQPRAGKPQGGSYFGGGLSRGFAGLRLGL